MKRKVADCMHKSAVAMDIVTTVQYCTQLTTTMNVRLEARRTSPGIGLAVTMRCISHDNPPHTSAVSEVLSGSGKTGRWYRGENGRGHEPHLARCRQAILHLRGVDAAIVGDVSGLTDARPYLPTLRRDCREPRACPRPSRINDRCWYMSFAARRCKASPRISQWVQCGTRYEAIPWTDDYM